MHLNIEIKAKCSNPQQIRKTLESEGAEYRGLDHQVDTYFKVNRGRLKLREGHIENALVFYERNNQDGPKDSKVVLYSSQSGSSLKQIISSSCGVLVVIDKQRHIYFIDNVKFHVDEVRNLGIFCEIEAIDQTGDIGKERLLQQCEYYIKLLGIKNEDLVSCSYSDLLMEDKK